VARVATDTFIPLDSIDLTKARWRPLIASPTLYPGQTVRAGVTADSKNKGRITCGLYIRAYGADDELFRVYGPEAVLEPGDGHEFEWSIEDTGGAPISEIGVELSSARRADGSVYLDYLTWDGTPDVVLTRPAYGGTMWRLAWIKGLDHFGKHWDEPYRIVQNGGTGLLIQGTREWTDYRVRAAVIPHLARAAGIGARVQGMRRYYALLLCEDGKARLVKALDGDTVLAEAYFPWELEGTYTLSLQVVGARLQGWIDDRLLFNVQDVDHPLTGGGVALICEKGCLSSDAVTVRPAG
jgi:hypothetical protein